MVIQAEQEVPLYRGKNLRQIEIVLMAEWDGISGGVVVWIDIEEGFVPVVPLDAIEGVEVLNHDLLHSPVDLHQIFFKVAEINARIARGGRSEGPGGCFPREGILLQVEISRRPLHIGEGFGPLFFFPDRTAGAIRGHR